MQLIFLLLLRIQYSQGFQSAVSLRPTQTPLRRRIPSSSQLHWHGHRHGSAHQKLPPMTRLSASAAVEAEEEAEEKPLRPDWALDWMPTWLVTMRPIVQLGVALILYTLHLTVLTQKSIVFPFQLLPNNLGHFTSLGLDSVAGIVSLLAYLHLRRVTKNRPTPAVPSLLGSPPKKERPWQFPKLKPMARLPGAKSTGLLSLYLLIQGYFMTGRFSVFWEDMLYNMAAVGFPMTIPMHRSLVVLLGHLTWIVVGGLILGIVPRPQPFFGGGYELNDDGTKKKLLKHRWYIPVTGITTGCGGPLEATLYLPGSSIWQILQIKCCSRTTCLIRQRRASSRSSLILNTTSGSPVWLVASHHVCQHPGGKKFSTEVSCYQPSVCTYHTGLLFGQAV